MAASPPRDAWHQCTNNLNRGVYILRSSRVRSSYRREICHDRHQTDPIGPDPTIKESRWNRDQGRCRDFLEARQSGFHCRAFRDRGRMVHLRCPPHHRPSSARMGHRNHCPATGERTAELGCPAGRRRHRRDALVAVHHRDSAVPVICPSDLLVGRGLHTSAL